MEQSFSDSLLLSEVISLNAGEHVVSNLLVASRDLILQSKDYTVLRATRLTPTDFI